MSSVQIGPLTIGGGAPLLVIAGPCVIESEAHALDTARVARESEVLVVLKTVRSRVDDVFRRLAETHPYEVPELVAVTVEEASQAYRQWVRRETIEVSA